MYRVACTRREASCILGNFFRELSDECLDCQQHPRDELVLVTTNGLTLTGEAYMVIMGHSAFTGEPATVRLTDYGFEFYGDIAEIDRIREARCVSYGGAVNSPKESPEIH